MKKLDYIDALRGLAILGVILVHVSLYGRSVSNHPLFERILLEGARGVQLFFLTSAFTQFLSMKSRHTGESFGLRNFFIRRFFRIAPLYYLGIAYYLFQEGLGPRYWLGDATHITASNIIANITFMHGFNPYWVSSVVPGGWSIAVEVLFYLFLPLLFLIIRNLVQAIHFFTFTLVLRALLELYFKDHVLIPHQELWNWYLFYYFPSQLPVFALGLILYFLVTGQTEEKGAWIRPSAGLLLLFILQWISGINFFFVKHILFGVAFMLLALVLGKYRLGLLVNPVVNYIGRISYSMYIVHFAVLYWFTRWNFVDYVSDDFMNLGMRFLCVTGITVLVSSGTYYLVEVPFQKTGKRLIEYFESLRRQTVS